MQELLFMPVILFYTFFNYSMRLGPQRMSPGHLIDSGPPGGLLHSEKDCMLAEISVWKRSLRL